MFTVIVPMLVLCATVSSYVPPPRMASGSVAAVDVPDHVTYLQDSALVMPPPALGAAVGFLLSNGEEVVAPGKEATLHPLVIPLTRVAGGETTGLLRWPAAGGGGSKLPVVRTSADGRQVSLLANSAEQFVARAAAVADADGSADAAALAELSGHHGHPYAAGDATKSAAGLPGYLITKVGPFESAYEDLANAHVAKGMNMTAALHPFPVHSSWPAAQLCEHAWLRWDSKGQRAACRHVRVRGSRLWPPCVASLSRWRTTTLGRLRYRCAHHVREE